MQQIARSVALAFNYITKNMGAYASLDYTKGDDIENPLQGVVGINVTW